jgi:hypothetical protein
VRVWFQKGEKKMKVTRIIYLLGKFKSLMEPNICNDETILGFWVVIAIFSVV